MSNKLYRPEDIPTISKPGLYELYINDPKALNSIRVGPSGLLYIGMTQSSLDSRNHSEHDNSGFSSLRRSLGALLKSKLHLRAIPRAQGSSKTNVTNYRFTEAGEQVDEMDEAKSHVWIYPRRARHRLSRENLYKAPRTTA